MIVATSGADVFLVDATVFKTVVGLHRPGWVRFPDAPAIFVFSADVLFPVTAWNRVPRLVPVRAVA